MRRATPPAAWRHLPPVAVAFGPLHRRASAVSPLPARGLRILEARRARGDFYTEAMDHYGCAVGARTLGIDLPPEQAQELRYLVGKIIHFSTSGWRRLLPYRANRPFPRRVRSTGPSAM